MLDTLIYQPLLGTLIFFFSKTGDLGISIILLTLAIRFALLPLTLPAMKASTKMREMKPEIDKLKKQYKDNNTKFQQAQLELFQKHQVNPASGCLPYLLQFVVLIYLYRVFINLLQNGHPQISHTQFLWLDLTKPDTLYILPIIAGISQLILSLIIMPAADTSAEKTLAASTKTQSDDEKADDMSQMANTMQQQMVFIMPLMTAFLALRFPSGLALYWVVGTIFSLVQQLIVSGPGGLQSYWSKAKSFLNR